MPKTKRRSPNQDDIDLGFRIRQLRQIKKLSLEDLAEKVPVSKQQLRKYELGRNKISACRLRRIAILLGVTPNDLLGYENDLSDIDKEVEHLWSSIRDLEHKRTVLAVMKIAVANST